MQINYSEYSVVGGRRKNEDMVQIVCYPQSIVAMVADGLGGHGDGDLASRLAVHTIGGVLCDGEFSQEALVDAVRRANSRIIDGQNSGSDMKTTIAAVWIGAERVYAAHVGDTRIYQFRDGQVVYQSLDHSVSQIAVAMGEIRKDQIRGHCDRNRLTRALGSHADVKVDVCELNIKPGDAFLLCSDGFWELILEEEMLQALMAASDAKDWLDAMCMYVERHQRPGADNSTAAAILIN